MIAEAAGHDREPESVLRAVIEAFPDATLQIEPPDTVCFANAEARRLLGLTRTTGPLSYFLRAPEVLDAIVLASGGETQKVRFHERVPSDRWIEVHVAPLRSARRNGAVLVVLRDLTQAERIERMRADFVANASHELRTPLASLLGFIETLQGPARDDPVARGRFLGIMRAQAERMSRLINDLLSLSRIELDEHVRPTAQVDLGDVVGQVVDGLCPMAQEQGVEIAFRRPERAPVIGARDELARLAENLVQNAIKYGATGKRIEVSIGVESGTTRPQTVLRVKDFGPGIAALHLPRLTERFYRVDVGESRAKGGTGLGLAIVKHIASRHRAALAIESTPGKGASFTVRFDPAE